MRERLVSYLLGELSPSEAAQLEQAVDADPALKEQLEHLRDCLLLGETCDDAPMGLADRTADSVHDLVLGLERVDSESVCPTTTPSDATPRSGGCRLRNLTLVDGGVAAGVVLALGMMLLPAIQESREASRRHACKNNLRLVGQALHGYDEEHAGMAPHVQPGENAGIFAVRLADSGFIDHAELAKLLVCRASSLGGDVASGLKTVRVPTAAELRRAKGAELASMQRLMGGSYAYRLGYVNGSVYVPMNRCRSSQSPILSDAPDAVRSGRWQSQNHGGCGQNVLFKDGGVRYRLDCLVPAADDNFFVNAEGAPAAGLTWNDAVLVRSEVTPGVLPAIASPGQFGQPRQFLRVRARIHIQAKADTDPAGTNAAE